MLDFATCERLVSTARDGRSKPYANNTRVEKRGDDAYALRLHATDIAMFYRDGRITLNSGGWRTVTTMDRLRAVTRHIYSERGTWFVSCEPDEPVAAHPPSASVLKPFHALDPGPEPVDDGVGCIAGQREEYAAAEYEPVYDWRPAPPPWHYISNRGSGSHRRVAHISYMTGIVWGESAHNSWGVDWKSVPVPPGWTYKQCPHCKRFRERHRAWEVAMHGGGWGRNRTHGYEKMCELLKRYGSREAWQEAYIADFRETREARKRWRETRDANRVPFEDGMEITASGYAKRPDPKQVARAQRELKRVERKRRKVREFVTYAMAELKSGRVPMPSAGDCFYCALRTDDGVPLGDIGDNDHLELHIAEKYVVPSMLVNAMRERGYQDAGIYMLLAMDPEHGTMGGERASTDSVGHALYRYLTSRLIPTIGGSAPTGIAPRHYETNRR